MADLEWLTIKEAATYLQRADRSLRRYLHEGRLESRQEPLPAGGFKYLISRQSLDILRESLDNAQGRHAEVDTVGQAGLTAQVQALQAIIEQQSEQIGELADQVAALRGSFQRLLPPAPEEPKALPAPAEPGPVTWWQKLFRRR